jgi:predicted nucleotidyltransferase
MAFNGMQLPQNCQVVLERFVTACQTDERVVAAFLHGSYATGAADSYSDLDLGLITTDEAYGDFLKEYSAFINLLGEPLLLEDFDLGHTFFFIFADGTEAELAIGSESHFQHIHKGTYKALLDKKGVLDEAVFSGEAPAQDEQVETLRRLIYWFWHDLSHFIAALGRGQLWWAYGQLEILRRVCVDLVRLQNDFTSPIENYEKLEKVVPPEQLKVLQTTFCPMERGVMLQAGRVVVQFYQELALSLAHAHALSYPQALADLMIDRLEKLQDTAL